MKNNLTKYELDLKNLVSTGKYLSSRVLFISQRRENESIEKTIKRLVPDAGDNIGDIAENIRNFSKDYELWYSESLAVIRQLVPDRLDDFRVLYNDTKRKSITYATYTISDYLSNVFLADRTSTLVSLRSKFDQQLNILRSAERRLSSSLYDMKTLIQADLFDNEIDAAESLQKAGYLRAAGAMCGVVLEAHLSQVCTQHNIKILKKNPTINDLNQSLRDGDVIEIATWRYIQHLADIRNKCDHKKSSEPTDSDIGDLISGCRKILKTVL